MHIMYRVKVLGTIVWEGHSQEEQIKIDDAVATTLKVTGAIKGKIKYGQSYTENGKMYYDVAWVRFE